MAVNWNCSSVQVTPMMVAPFRLVWPSAAGSRVSKSVKLGGKTPGKRLKQASLGGSTLAVPVTKKSGAPSTELGWIVHELILTLWWQVILPVEACR